MTRTEKVAAIETLKQKFTDSSFFYIADSSALTVEEITKFRRECFSKGVEVKVVKNKLAQKALEQFPEEKNFGQLYEVLKGPSTLMFTETANVPAKIIEEFRKDHEKPLLKAAYIDTAVYIGDDNITALTKLKSKEELLGELIGMLDGPMSSVLSALGSGGSTIASLLTALEERAEPAE